MKTTAQNESVILLVANCNASTSSINEWQFIYMCPIYFRVLEILIRLFVSLFFVVFLFFFYFYIHSLLVQLMFMILLLWLDLHSVALNFCEFTCANWLTRSSHAIFLHCAFFLFFFFLLMKVEFQMTFWKNQKRNSFSEFIFISKEHFFSRVQCVLCYLRGETKNISMTSQSKIYTRQWSNPKINYWMRPLTMIESDENDDIFHLNFHFKSFDVWKQTSAKRTHVVLSRSRSRSFTVSTGWTIPD